jgi:glutathione synthase/RimK-type ligase-like ATP-grasp enzyme
MILIISHPGDDHARGVMGRCHDDGQQVVQFDTARYPLDAPLVQHFDTTGPARTTVVLDDAVIDLDDVHTVWWRRPRPFTLADGLAPEVGAFTYSECSEAFAGMLHSLDALWVNPPALDEVAHHKPYQLSVARQVGLEIPRTLITNDPMAAAAFVEDVGLGHVVYKTFLATADNWRETRLLRSSEIGELGSLRLAPAIFQQRVPAEADVRVTVVGEEVFATAITTTPGTYELDYRMDLESARFAPTALPAATLRGVRALMGRLGLVYGAIDFLRQADGNHVFLEINPAGEWLFVEERTGQDITGAMASLLTSRLPARRRTHVPS